MTRRKTRFKLLVVGDSITLGVTELRLNEVAGRVKRSYLDLLRERLPEIEFAAEAELHRTSVAVRDRVDGWIAAHRPDAVLLMIGGNDADMEWKRFLVSEGKVARTRVPVEQFAAAMRTIVQKVVASRITPILTDPSNHYLARRGPYLSAMTGKDVSGYLERGGGQAKSDATLRLYRVAVRELAAEFELPLVPYGSVLGQHPAEEVVGVDGVHPSERAHKIMADCLTVVLRLAVGTDGGRGARGRESLGR